MGKKRQIVVYPIEETKSSVFDINIYELLEENCAEYVIIEASRDCEIGIKFKGTTSQKYPKGLKMNVPLAIESEFPSIERLRITPDASTKFYGWATVEVKRGGG